MLVGAFFAGVAVGKGEAPAKAKFVAAEEMKWDDLPGGPKIAVITGDYKKGAYTGLLKLPAGFTSPAHSHTGTYEAIEISGTSSHWLKGEDGTKAKKMTPGSYWTFQGKADHVSSCAAGADCVMYIWQKTKFDFVPAKEAAGAAAGSGAAKAPAAGAGSAAKK